MKLSDHDLRQLDEKVIRSLSPDAVENLAVNLLDDLKDSRERQNQNSQNSSRPPSSQAPWDKPSAHTDQDDVENDDESSEPLTEDEALAAAVQSDNTEDLSTDTGPEKYTRLLSRWINSQSRQTTRRSGFWTNTKDSCSQIPGTPSIRMRLLLSEF